MNIMQTELRRGLTSRVDAGFTDQPTWRDQRVFASLIPHLIDVLDIAPSAAIGVIKYDHLQAA